MLAVRVSGGWRCSFTLFGMTFQFFKGHSIPHVYHYCTAIYVGVLGNIFTLLFRFVPLPTTVSNSMEHKSCEGQGYLKPKIIANGSKKIQKDTSKYLKKIVHNSPIYDEYQTQ